jgi:hypothetical protein
VEDVINNPDVITPRKPGRPFGTFKYKTLEDLQEAINKYFEETKTPYFDKQGKLAGYNTGPYTMAGLAYSLGVSRMTLLRYNERDDNYSDALTRARARVEDYAEGRLYDRDGSNGAKFALENNHEGWKAQQNAIPASTLTADDALRLISGMVDLLGKMQRPMRNVTPDTPAIDASIDDAPCTPHG